MSSSPTGRWSYSHWHLKNRGAYPS